MSDRRHKILHDLDIAGGEGLEIGPLMWPAVTKDQGRVTYVDFTDTATLRAKYAGSTVVDPALIVEVDAIWGEKTLAQAVGEGRQFDYVVASHVIEHVPDLIAWLNEVAEVLKPGGQIRLVVPDKRFTFDFFRRETELSDVLNAHLLKARRPLPGLILDYCLNFVVVDMVRIWNRQDDVAQLQRAPDWIAKARDWARRSHEDGEYIDIHCWVFTPVGFARLMEQIVAEGLVACRCTSFSDTAENTNEFFVGMAHEPDRAAAIESWRQMQVQAAAGGSQGHFDLRGTLAEREKAAIRADLDRAGAELAAVRARLAQVERDLEAARAARTDAEGRAAAMTQSRSWRYTAMLRRVSDRLGRRG